VAELADGEQALRCRISGEDGSVMQPSTGSEPQTIYVDLTDATNDAIGMTGRFMRGQPRDIIALTLIVWACFELASITFSRPARDQLTQYITNITTDFSILGLADFAFATVAAPI
jgi:hypothetical protein